MPRRYKYQIAFINILLATIILLTHQRIPIFKCCQWKIFDFFARVEKKFSSPAAALNDITLVIIDSETVQNMQERWPYERRTFARVIDNLVKAQAKIIAFDFVFLGATTPESDLALVHALQQNNKIILASTIDENGEIHTSSLPFLGQTIPISIVTKVQDSDGVIRRCLTYLIDEKRPHNAFLSWEMQILKKIHDIDLSTLQASGSNLCFEDQSGKKWTIPIDKNTKSFLIHPRANSSDFTRVSFHRVLKNDFNPVDIKDKIVLIGPLSCLFHDIHNTPKGWLPGITLNANAFLTLHTQDFFKDIPCWLEWPTTLFACLIAAYFVSSYGFKKALYMIGIEIIFFLIVGYVCYVKSWLWNYPLIPITVLTCSFLGKKIHLILTWFLYKHGAETTGFAA